MRKTRRCPGSGTHPFHGCPYISHLWW